MNPEQRDDRALFSPDDLKQLRLLWFQLHAWHAARAPDRYRSASPEAFDSWYAWAEKEHRFFTERIAGVIRGYATARVVVIPGNASMRSRRYAYLDHVVVDQATRGGGLGRRLVQQAMAFAHENGCGHLELDCRSDNPASDFFAAAGFVPVSQRLTLALVGPGAASP